MVVDDGNRFPDDLVFALFLIAYELRKKAKSPLGINVSYFQLTEN
jgi:hypothetical protein